jgi:hypothetical protein
LESGFNADRAHQDGIEGYFWPHLKSQSQDSNGKEKEKEKEKTRNMIISLKSESESMPIGRVKTHRDKTIKSNK